MAKRVEISSDGGSQRKSGPNSKYPDFKSAQRAVDTSDIDQRESEADDFDYDQAIAQADESDNPDGYKYQVAVELAKNKAGDDVDDQEMRDLVDSEFAKLNPTATGAQMRGEDNIGAQAMGGMNDALNGLSDMIGGGLDAGWDFLAGGLAGIAGDIAGGITGNEGWGDAANEFVSGLVGDEEGALLDTRTLGNMAVDLGLAAIPGVGVPLAATKAGIQNSDNIRELVEGRDSISREQLSGDARLAKLGATALNVGLAAAPGVGKLRNAAAADDIVRSSGDDLAKAFADATQIGGGRLSREVTPAAMGRVARNAVNEGGSRLSSAAKAVKDSNGLRDAAGSAISALRTPTAEQATRNTIESLIANVGRPEGRAIAKAMVSDGAEAATRAADDAIVKRIGDAAANAAVKSQRTGMRGALENLGNMAKSGAGKVMHPFKTGALKRGVGDVGQNLLGAGGNLLGSIGVGGVNYAADSNQGIGTGIGQMTAALAQGTEPDSEYGPVIRSLLIPLGMNVVMGSNRMPGVRGRMGSTNPALRYVQMQEGGNIGSDLGERARQDYMGNDDIYDWLAVMMDGSER